MSKYNALWFWILAVALLISCNQDSKDTDPANITYLNYTSIIIDQNKYADDAGVSLIPTFTINFDDKIDLNSVRESVILTDVQERQILLTSKTNHGDSTLVIQPQESLKPLTRYNFEIAHTLKSASGNNLSSTVKRSFTTKLDTTDKYPMLTDEELLTTIQRKTFKYFWDLGHPVSGLILERNTSANLVTTGGSGFGIMAIIAGIERKFITRIDGLERISKMVKFLDEKAEKYHGAFAHWIDGQSGKTIPFSMKDDGADLVETSFLIAGMLCAKAYFDQNNLEELELRNKITAIWEGVEWSWFDRDDKSVLLWHWSPKYNWDINLPIKGWNEALITYILASSSPTFPIATPVYDTGWASNGGMKNGKSYYGIFLPLGPSLGGPLFFEHYSFLGINPIKLKDKYTEYATQTRNHTLINRSYCMDNPRRYYGYNKNVWGLTASDTRGGYTAHSPTNDKGVITPTAAIASLPYTPEESMQTIRYFYYKLGDRIFKDYGFIDAFSMHYLWFADSYLAIDQGPIMVMIENYRTGLIWNYTMKDPDIQHGLRRLGFEF